MARKLPRVGRVASRARPGWPRGLGPLEELLDDPTAEAILVEGPGRIYVQRSGRESLTPLRFRDEAQLASVISRIAACVGRRVDETIPMVDARLKDGSRIHAILPPVAVHGPALTIRRSPRKVFTGERLVELGALSAPMWEFLAACVKLRKSILLCGGTGTGKTAFLSLLAGLIPEGERIVTVEDTAELRLARERWIRLESRPPDLAGRGEVSLRELFRSGLRLGPDRVVVGECRGPEAYDMISAMSAGHEGLLAAVHANAPREALARIEAMCMMAAPHLPVWALRELIGSGVKLLVQLTRFHDGVRRVTYVTEVTGREENVIRTDDLFRYRQTGVSEDGRCVGYFTGCGSPPRFYEEFKLAGLDVPPESFAKAPGPP